MDATNETTPSRPTQSGWERLSIAAIRAAAATRLVDRETSEEVAQDALLTYCRLPFAPRSPLAWLRITVRRLIWRRIHRSKLERRAQLEFLQDIREERYDRHLDLLSLDEIGKRLPERSRRILELVRGGLSHDEIAEKLNCKLHQVGPRIARALMVARRRSRPSSKIFKRSPDPPHV